MTLFEPGSQLTLPVNSDLRKTVTSVCVKTLAKKLVQDIRENRVKFKNNLLPDLNEYRQKLKNETNAQSHRLIEFYRS